MMFRSIRLKFGRTSDGACDGDGPTAAPLQGTTAATAYARPPAGQWKSRNVDRFNDTASQSPKTSLAASQLQKIQVKDVATRRDIIWECLARTCAKSFGDPEKWLSHLTNDHDFFKGWICWDKPADGRIGAEPSFCRSFDDEEGLLWHLQKYHTLTDPDLLVWKLAQTSLQLTTAKVAWCGFCNEPFVLSHKKRRTGVYTAAEAQSLAASLASLRKEDFLAHVVYHIEGGARPWHWTTFTARDLRQSRTGKPNSDAVEAEDREAGSSGRRPKRSPQSVGERRRRNPEKHVDATENGSEIDQSPPRRGWARVKSRRVDSQKESGELPSVPEDSHHQLVTEVLHELTRTLSGSELQRLTNDREALLNTFKSEIAVAQALAVSKKHQAGNQNGSLYSFGKHRAGSFENTSLYSSASAAQDSNNDESYVEKVLESLSLSLNSCKRLQKSATRFGRKQKGPQSEFVDQLNRYLETNEERILHAKKLHDQDLGDSLNSQADRFQQKVEHQLKRHLHLKPVPWGALTVTADTILSSIEETWLTAEERRTRFFEAARELIAAGLLTEEGTEAPAYAEQEDERQPVEGASSADASAS